MKSSYVNLIQSSPAYKMYWPGFLKENSIIIIRSFMLRYNKSFNKSHNQVEERVASIHRIINSNIISTTNEKYNVHETTLRHYTLKIYNKSQFIPIIISHKV